jgi:hypothetical protein
MELVRILEMDDEIYVTGRFKATHTGSSPHLSVL